MTDAIDTRTLDALVAERLLEIPKELIHTDAEPRTINGIPVRAVDHYSDNTSDAMDLLDALIEKGYEPSLQYHLDTQKWEVRIILTNGTPENDWKNEGSAIDESPSLAIVRAALELVGYEES